MGLNLFAALKPKQVKKYKKVDCLCPTCATGKIAKDQVAYLERLAASPRGLKPEQRAKLHAYRMEVAHYQAHSALGGSKLQFWPKRLNCAQK